MGLETATYISGLVETNPTAGDLISAGDDHLRLLKAVLKASFPNISGAVSASNVELSYVSGVTSALQAQLNGKAASSHSHAETDIQDGNTYSRIAGNETITGIWNFTNRPTVAGQGVLDAASSLLEARIADGTILARVGSNETITGNWNFSTAPLIGSLGVWRWATTSLTSGRITLQNGGVPAATGTAGDIVLVY